VSTGNAFPLTPPSPHRGEGENVDVFSTAQKPHPLVQTSPRIIKVAVGFEKHSPIFGHRADSHTVCRFLLRRIFFIVWSLLGWPIGRESQEGSRFVCCLTMKSITNS